MHRTAIRKAQMPSESRVRRPAVLRSILCAFCKQARFIISCNHQTQQLRNPHHLNFILAQQSCLQNALDSHHRPVQFRILFCLVVMSLDLPLIQDTVVLRCFYFHDFDIFEDTSWFLCLLSLSVDLLLPQGVGASQKVILCTP